MTSYFPDDFGSGPVGERFRRKTKQHMTKTIEIDIEVYRAIETRRKSFAQSENDILREVFGISPVSLRLPLSPKRPRRTGRCAFALLGERVEGDSLKGAYMNCLRQLAELDPQLLERLSEKTTKARRIVARRPEDLYLKKSAEFAEEHAEQLTDQWWVDTNLSRSGFEQRLKTACEVAGIGFGSDLVLDFRDT